MYIHIILETNEDAMLEHAIAMSMTDDDKATPASIPDFGSMTEDEQIAYAMRMSLSASGKPSLASISNSNSAHYAHSNLLYITTELREILGPVFQKIQRATNMLDLKFNTGPTNL